MIQVPGAADDRATYAGFWRRFAAYAIDYVIVLLGTAVLGAAATIAGLGDDSFHQLGYSRHRSCIGGLRDPPAPHLVHAPARLNR